MHFLTIASRLSIVKYQIPVYVVCRHAIQLKLMKTCTIHTGKQNDFKHMNQFHELASTIPQIVPQVPLHILAALFVIYSIGGWIFETIYSSIRRRRWCNRGFGMGPWCPIYGVGGAIATAIIPATLPIHMQFIESAFIMTALEYLSSVIMERMFGARWWDYKDKPFNIDGRVCLYGFLTFGLMCSIVVSYLSPAIINILNTFPQDIVSATSACLVSIIAIDLLRSATALTSLSGKMSDAAIEETMERIGETVDDKQQMDENMAELERKLEDRKAKRLSTVPPELYEYISSMGERARETIAANAEKTQASLAAATETLKQTASEKSEAAKAVITEAASKLKADDEERKAEAASRRAKREAKREARMRDTVGKLNSRERRIAMEFPRIHMTEAGSEDVLSRVRSYLKNIKQNESEK